MFRNGLVLALHALACVAGFMAGSSLPCRPPAHRLSRWVHEKAGPLAIAFVMCATAFSLVHAGLRARGTAASLAAQLDSTPASMLLGLLPHAIPSSTALFLPLAAWTLASRRGAGTSCWPRPS